MNTLIISCFSVPVSVNQTVMVSDYPGNNTSSDCSESSCLEWSESYQRCIPHECYSYDDVLQECERVGPSKTTTLILQGIPVTGMMGVAWGTLERWDIFAVSMSLVFGLCVMSCFVVGCAMCICSNERSEKFIKSYGIFKQCLGCLVMTASAVFWIWGIFVMADGSQMEAYHEDDWGRVVRCDYIK